MMRRFLLALGLVTLSLNAAAKQQPLPVPLAEQLPVEVVLNQQELAVDVPNTASQVGMQFGLIGALIGSGIQNAQAKKAEERVIPLRNELLGYPFNLKLEAALRARLASEGISPSPAIVMMETPWDMHQSQRDTQQMPLTAMVLIPRYSVSNDFDLLSVSLTAQLVDREIRPNGKVKTRYRYGRTYSFNFPLAGEGREENLERWVAMGAPRLGEMIDQGVDQVVDMLVYDLSTEGRADWDNKAKSQLATVNGVAYQGTIVREAPEWVWVRTGNGVQRSLQGYHPIALAGVAVQEQTAPGEEAAGSAEAGSESGVATEMPADVAEEVPEAGFAQATSEDDAATEPGEARPETEPETTIEVPAESGSEADATAEPVQDADDESDAVAGDPSGSGS